IASSGAADYQIDNHVDVYPITPGLIEKMRKPMLKSQQNPSLDDQGRTWGYRVGAGEILTVTVWDHPEITTPAGQYR
ncbi:polysaccharide export protein Wza, partial [Escherichia coli]